MFKKPIEPQNVWVNDAMLQKMVSECYNKDIRYIGMPGMFNEMTFEIVDCERDRIEEEKWKNSFMSNILSKKKAS